MTPRRGMPAAVRSSAAALIWVLLAVGTGGSGQTPGRPGDVPMRVLSSAPQYVSGGDVRIESRPGEGTCVRLYFPPAPASVATTATERPPLPAKLDCRVLLVEDNAAVAEATRSLLQSMGCETTHVATGDAAWKYIGGDANPADIVLTDIEVPGSMDGIALGKAIMARYPGLPVLWMTGYAERLREAIELRREVLPKPCSSETLAQAIAKAVSNQRATVDPKTASG